MYIIIVGCGSLGGHLANELSSEGQDVVVIDKNAEAFSELNEEFSGFKVTANATEAEVLSNCRAKDANALIVCTENDNVNLMIAQIAKKIYNVNIVMARVFNPDRQSVYEELNIETICPTILSAMKFKETIMAMAGKGEII